jgi:hypothetical protein
MIRGRWVYVYIAGPYRLPDPIKNTRNAIIAAEELISRKVFVPVIPHLNMLWHFYNPKPDQFWLDYDLLLLNRCDVMLRLPGDSEGADREEVAARERKIPVFGSIPSLCESKLMRDHLRGLGGTST